MAKNGGWEGGTDSTYIPSALALHIMHVALQTGKLKPTEKLSESAHTHNLLGTYVKIAFLYKRIYSNTPL